MEAVRHYSRTLTTWIDPSIWQAYQIGLGLGIVIVSTLILFPGVVTQRPIQNDLNVEATIGSSHLAQHESPKRRRNKTNDRSSLQTPLSNNNNNNNTNSSFDSSSAAAWTPHCRLNTAVYLIICTVATVAILHLYSDNSTATETSANAAVRWVDRNHPLALFWRAYFPKETAVLLGQPVTRTTQRNQSPN